jgi:hypothetical protein
VEAAVEPAADAHGRAVEIHRDAAELHGRAVEFFLKHATMYRLNGDEKWAVAMERLAEREREREAEELWSAERAELGERRETAHAPG